MEKRNRNFIFTQNNYVDTIMVDSVNCRYIGYSHEIGDSGTPHLQGFICFTTVKTLKQVIKLMPGCHISSMKGSISQNEAYCSKSSKLIERGDKPLINSDKGRAEQLRWQGAKEFAKNGQMEDIDADMYCKYYSTWKAIEKDFMQRPEPLEEPCGIWLVGKSGSGKSHAVETTYPELYRKSKDKWWCGYRKQEVVMMDDVDIYDIRLAGLIKTWADKWTFHAENKGGAFNARPKKFIITSQYEIEEIWMDEPTRAALLRRFKVIKVVKGHNVCV